MADLRSIPAQPVLRDLSARCAWQNFCPACCFYSQHLDASPGTRFVPKTNLAGVFYEQMDVTHRLRSAVERVYRNDRRRLRHQRQLWHEQ
jgi:hypothetical protein